MPIHDEELLHKIHLMIKKVNITNTIMCNFKLAPCYHSCEGEN